MLFEANIAFEQEVTVTAIVSALFTRFWCTPAHVQSNPVVTLR